MYLRVLGGTNHTQDVLAQWISEECEFPTEPTEDTSFDTAKRDLYAHWKIWCRGGDFDHGNEKSFMVSLDAKASTYGFTAKTVGASDSRKRGYRGIRLKHSVTGGFDV